MKRMPLAAACASSAVLLLAGCAPAEVAISVRPGLPASAPPTAAAAATSFALWADESHSSFTVTAWGGVGDCAPVASGVSTQSVHRLTVVLADQPGKVCAAMLAATTFTLRTPDAIDQHHAVVVTVAYNKTSTTVTLPGPSGD